MAEARGSTEVHWNQRYIEANTPWDSGVPSQELQGIVANGLVKPCRVLELGCGTGTNAIFLAQKGFQVTAVDLSSVALERARTKAKDAGVSINYVQADVTALPDVGLPFPFVFDRGTYHIVREINLKAFQSMLAKVVEPAGLYVVLAGNANEINAPEQGPPRVKSYELCSELEGKEFDLIQMKEMNFHGVKIEGRELEPLAWMAVFRRRHSTR